jgi:hypothetical protein
MTGDAPGLGVEIAPAELAHDADVGLRIAQVPASVEPHPSSRLCGR